MRVNLTTALNDGADIRGRLTVALHKSDGAGQGIDSHSQVVVVLLRILRGDEQSAACLELFTTGEKAVTATSSIMSSMLPLLLLFLLRLLTTAPKTTRITLSRLRVWGVWLLTSCLRC